jgi:probable phosphoglycerate mutase
MKNSSHWPERIMIARHGQSAGNVAAEAAEAAGHSNIDLAIRDTDVPLSALGERQAEALGQWIATLPKEQQPTVILASPYVRAFQTAEIALRHFQISDQLSDQLSDQPIQLVHDERLREREFGIVDRLTKKGIVEKFPFQAELYDRIQKFYYRPPGGESWCDVILRLRSVMDTLSNEYAGERVMIVCHGVVVMCFRYLFERMTEEQILTIDRENLVANCSLTTYLNTADPQGLGGFTLEKFNFVAPLANAGEKITSQPDATNLPK